MPALRVFLAFLRIGATSFGGPLSAMALMEKEFVRARSWVSPEKFKELLTVCKLLPGPNATNLAICLGRERGGLASGFAAGMGFLLPAFVSVLFLSVLYSQGTAGGARWLGPVLAAVQSAALVLIAGSVTALAKGQSATPGPWVISAVAMVVTILWPTYEAAAILAAGIGGAWIAARRSQPTTVQAAPETLIALFLSCFKGGALGFGTGFAIVPMLEADVVQRYEWLSHSQFMDGIALGQATPGPVVITATFIGYLTAGLTGAFVATLGIFLAPFVNSLFLVPAIWTPFSRTQASRGFLAAAIPAVVGGLAGTSLRLGWLHLRSPIALASFAALAVIQWRLKPPAWVLVLLAAVGGALAALSPV